MAVDVTVLVSTYNRTLVLERCLEALGAQRPARIVVLDNGSDLPDALDLLDRLERDGLAVYRRGPITYSYDRLEESVAAVLDHEWRELPRPRWYAVTDADVVLDGPADSLETYGELAGELEAAVGPHLRPNVHRNYPLRSRVLVQQTKDLYRDRMSWRRDGRAGTRWFSWLPIDTTFHVFPAGPSFRRFALSSVRVGPPFWATHLDWTIDGLAPRPDELAYALAPGSLGSWGKTWIAGVLRSLAESPERAFDEIARSAAAYDAGDYANDRFILSWMLQRGIGCEPDLERSRAALRSAVPEGSPCWEREPDWDGMVYDDDLSCLGWDAW